MHQQVVKLTDALLNTKALGLFNFTFMRSGNGEFHHTYDRKPSPGFQELPELVCGNSDPSCWSLHCNPSATLSLFLILSSSPWCADTF